MRLICDFHIHSKYSRATSKNMDLEHLLEWAKYKGVGILGTGDFTHPFWFDELKNKLEPLGNGFFKFKNSREKFPLFILTTEVSCIYSEGGKLRKIHLLIFAPSFKTVALINERLSDFGNLYADGRPTFSLSAYDLLQLILNIDENCFVVPAHVWTPWFSLFGANSGFDSIKECFKDLSSYIYALETGLSSDPEMNWRISALDKICLISNSDSHSPSNIAREANVFEIKDIEDFSYQKLIELIKNSAPFNRKPAQESDKFLYTIEFFPEEGKYHFDGHRNCGLRMSPKEAIKNNNICPKCGKPLTIGVLHRVEALADREEGFKPKNAVDSVHLVPLIEIIAEALGQNKNSKAVEAQYFDLIFRFDSEFSILLEKSEEELKKGGCPPNILEGILKARKGDVLKIPGYDGIYGKISVFGKGVDKEKKMEYTKEEEQMRLF